MSTENKNVQTEAVQEAKTVTVHSGKKDQSDNLVKLIGKITKITEENSVTILRISIPRRGRGGEAQFSVPKVYFFSSDNTGVEQFMKGDSVKITGHLTNPMKRRPDGTTFFSQAVIGDKIEKNTSLFESELDIESGEDLVTTQPVSLVYLRGEVEAITSAGNRAINLRINARQNGRNNHVNVIVYERNLGINPGDVVTIYGRLETRTTERNGQYRLYQNVVSQKVINHSKKDTK